MSESKQEKQPDFPELVFIEELGTPPGNFDYDPSSCQGVLTLDETQVFQKQWNSILTSGDLVKHINKDKIVQISKYAQEQTQQMQWPPENVNYSQLQLMTALGVSKGDGGQIVRLVHQQEKGIPLPAHNPLVKRNLCFYADFSKQSQSIKRVIVTVRGWREE